MVMKERLPPLRWRTSPPDHILGHARLSDIDAELEQFSVDPRSAHSGLAMLISRISRRISGGTIGLPPRRRDLQRQYDLNPARCHFIAVSGFTIARAFMTVGTNRYSATKIRRSASLKVCLFGKYRRWMLSWWRRTRISASNEARDRNNPTNTDQIRLQPSLISQNDCLILPQLSARLGLRQGQVIAFG